MSKTIDEAVKLIEHLFVRRPNLIDSDYDAAIKLGLEALKRIKALRRKPTLSPLERLPGETTF